MNTHLSNKPTRHKCVIQWPTVNFWSVINHLNENVLIIIFGVIMKVSVPSAQYKWSSLQYSANTMISESKKNVSIWLQEQWTHGNLQVMW